jgi:hypothetical protein
MPWVSGVMIRVDLAEFGMSVVLSVDIGMVLSGEFVVGSFDLFFGGISVDS